MSTLQELAARLRASLDQLPFAQVSSAANHLQVATDLLNWVRQSSPHGMGVPQLGHAVERLEHAVSALRGCQDRVDEYLVGLGLPSEPSAPYEPVVRTDRAQPVEPAAGPDAPQAIDATPLRRWWSSTVDRLTEPEGAEPGAATSADRPPPSGGTAPDPVELIRRVAGQVRDRDRSALRAELRRTQPPVGLSLTAVSPVALRQLSTELLGHDPRPEDLPRLRDATRQRLREVLPGLPERTSETLLARVCKVRVDLPAEERHKAAERAAGQAREREQRQDGPLREQRLKQDERPEERDDPVDSAVAGAVLVGLLLERLGRDPDQFAEQFRRPDAEPATGGSGPGPAHA